MSVSEFIESLTALVTVIGGRKGTEVAGRAWHDIHACVGRTRSNTGGGTHLMICPVAVLGLVEGSICGSFSVEPAMRAGAYAAYPL